MFLTREGRSSPGKGGVHRRSRRLAEIEPTQDLSGIPAAPVEFGAAANMRAHSNEQEIKATPSSSSASYSSHPM